MRVGVCRLAEFKQDFKRQSHLRRCVLWRTATTNSI